MTQQEAQAVAAALADRFGGQADPEEVAAGRFRFTILSPRFTGVPHMKRQDEVWEVIDALLDRERRLDLSLVVALAPDEAELVPHP